MADQGSVFARADRARAFDPAALLGFAARMGDVALILDADGRILDVTLSGEDFFAGATAGWTGRRWADVVSPESQSKVADMIATTPGSGAHRWRQVNHRIDGLGDIPVRWLVTRSADGAELLAVGRDMRAESRLQQRLLQAQQTLERDYTALRDAQARYRLLFELDPAAVLIIDADSRRIREANRAAHRLLGAKPGVLVNRPLLGFVADDSADAVLAHLGAAGASDGVPPVEITLADGRGAATLTALGFRQGRAQQFLVRVLRAADSGHGAAATLAAALDELPDALVITGPDFTVADANEAFAELAQEASVARMIGRPLSAWLGRVGIDVDLIADQLRQHGVARNVATILRGRHGGIEEIEVSAAAVERAGGGSYILSLRPVGRRVRDLPPLATDMPRSVEQLTELVGRMSLKEIVRESTDLIERLCIEAALEYTSDNRASAAEILGVSRQSLYSKLHRHGLGNLVADD